MNIESQSSVTEGAQALSVTGVRKSYGAVRALTGVDFSVNRGEVRALVGSNGAGKSTLMKIVSGSERPDDGVVQVAGKTVSFGNTSDAAAAGVACVYQELSLVQSLSIGENIMLGRWKKRPVLGMPLVDMRATWDAATEALDYLGEPLDVRETVANLSIGQQQVVEIAKALSNRPDLLILDEPTSALAQEEADRLIELVRRLAKVRGLAVIYISHRMDEIPRVADSVTVMRDGAVVANLPVKEATTEGIASLMLGASVDQRGAARELNQPHDRIRLSVRSLTREPLLHDVSFDLRHGEVLGIAGLMGSGRSELLRCIFGRDRFDSGTVEVDGTPIIPTSERVMIRAGVGLVPENRREEGLVVVHSILRNLTMAGLSKFSSAGVLSPPTEKRLGQNTSDRLGIKHSGLSQPVSSLSGGNQQKVVFGKWLAADSEIVLLDEPTRGVDLHAKAQIYELIRRWAADGRSIVMVSSEFEELFQVCHRIAVMSKGHLEAPVDVDRTSMQQILKNVMKE